MKIFKYTEIMIFRLAPVYPPWILQLTFHHAHFITYLRVYPCLYLPTDPFFFFFGTDFRVNRRQQRFQYALSPQCFSVQIISRSLIFVYIFLSFDVLPILNEMRKS